MDKAEILAAIRRIAASNGGRAPGSLRLQSEIGLRKVDWYPKHWFRWSDAVREAGCQPNSRSVRFGTDFLIEKYVAFIREIGRFPIDGDLIMKRRADSEFPSRDALSKLGTKAERVAKILAYCLGREGLEDVARIVEAATIAPAVEQAETSDEPRSGFVYLVKHGSRSEYKIGFTHNRMRREGEIRVELPQELRPVHSIQTDDPAGVERYWHRRFTEKRLKNEWFALTAADVRAFKRWKRIF